MTRRSALTARRAVMGGLALVVGIGGIVVGAVREEAVVPATAAAAPPSRAAASDLRFLRRDDPARTTVVDAAGTVLATFTDGARTVTLDGPERTFAEPQFAGAPVITRVWVRLLPEEWRAGAESAPWFRPWLQQNLGRTEPDVLAMATEYLDGAPEGRDAEGVRVRGDARYGPPAPGSAAPLENSDFVDYLGVSWRFADGEVRQGEPGRYGAVDCSGFIRLVYGYRAGYPLRADNERGPGLPRRARAMVEVGPGAVLLPDTGAPPSNLGVLQAGDLLFFDLDGAPDQRIDHSAIYLGRDAAGQHRFLSSRVRADGPTLGDLGGTSLLDGGGHYSRSFRAAKRL
ncbi:NlpC/P60 family protein [Pseudonocardia kunmingensis]|uniref:NlpC/P60 family protein n=1 Tax=Pseudonocardia kunmingensis TaxID=630975 RepID=A0A543D9F7_9PSEU|nr:NlpC/P60 family protein [Pseudonocardia kunmingensis]TQM05936.1 NlpC/P60 family protein [Pseudonocardia kunmingensis]